MKLFLFYRLSEGVTIEEYRRWSISRDQPTLRMCAGIDDYRVFQVADTQGKTPYDVVECVEVSDWETWRAVTSSGAMLPIVNEFERLVDQSSVVTLQGEEMVP